MVPGLHQAETDAGRGSGETWDNAGKIMTTIRRYRLFRVSIVALAALLRPPTAAGNDMKFRGSFANLDGSKAAAQLHARMSDAGSWMVIRASRLGGSVPLSLEVRDAGGGNATVASFVANRRGQVSLRFRTVPRSARDLALGFDPRGKTLVISVASGDRLEIEVPGDDTPPPGGGGPPPGGTCTAVDTGDVFLVPQAGAGTAKARFRRDAGCKRDFRVEADDVPVGSYDLCSGGTALGSFDVVDNGVQIEGEIEFDDQPDQPDERPFPAGFSDPQGQPLEVHAAGATSCSGALLFSFASFPDDPGAPGGQPPATCTAVDTGDLFLVPAAGIGTAKARFRRQADCGRDFRVEVEDVAPGSFEVCVGGVSFGSFDVADNGLQIEGEIELDDQPDQPGERPFPAALPDPVGERIEVRRSGATPCSGILFFSFASFPDNPGTP